MKLYSTWTHITWDGRRVPIPIGVSASWPPSRKDRTIITVNAQKQIKVITVKRPFTTEGLKEACKVLRKQINKGSLPGPSGIKRSLNISEHYNPNTDAYSLVVSYPCITKAKRVRKYIYLGTAATRDVRYAKTLQKAITLRDEKIAEYVTWFKKQLRSTIKELYENE